MTWKTIGQSVIGTSHIASGKTCEDAVSHKVFVDKQGNEVLVCCASDGAGSAAHAAFAATFAVDKVIAFAAHLLLHDEELTECHIYAMAEDIYYGLEQEAINKETELNEFSCTLLGCIITKQKSAFFQIGDGAIVRNDANDNYTVIWWPQNGEYQNATSFLVDDCNFSNLRVTIIDETINEVAIFTDGLQQLILNTDSHSVHQPFFTDLFKYLRIANDEDKVNVLNRKLATYLDSPQINERTDDDKTLLLATRQNA